ncbi:ferric reductase-like transmembrane domain-containing protein [Peptostreptococcus anaerobius]|uniref:ferric reductase-like transmembrane domain-containing protein n=2 Tax=Peptostreptococcus anaerobius TaxID=1261 RepID=UPI00210C8CE0|nr:ferric reductase-like transmembrane domain-containing protein [Peptostreptococcus anaerobius]
MIRLVIEISIFIIVALAYYFADYIKKYCKEIYIVTSVISLMSIAHTIYLLNGYSINYVVGLKQFMRAIDSGAMGGAFFVMVMYMGVFDMKYKISKRLRMNRGELSIIACIFTLPHNIHYFFAFLLNSKNIVKMTGIPLWTNLMMFSAGVFAIGIMLPLFVTSFRLIRKKMTGKKWKSLQEFAYIFYAMVFVQVLMVYIAKPSSLVRNVNLIFYCLVFMSYTIFKLKIIIDKKYTAKKASLAVK